MPPIITRPNPSEHAAYYGPYIARVPGDDLLAYFRTQTHTLASVLGVLDDVTASKRYAEGKWSVKEVASHIIDTERVFAYRAMCISRGEAQSLPGFEENAYVANSNADARSVADLVEEYKAVRTATVALLFSLSDEMATRTGRANNNPASVRAIGYMIAGHELHHLSVIEERYVGR